MSHFSITNLLEDCADIIDEAEGYQRYFVSTTAGKILDRQVAELQRKLDAQDYEGIYNETLPALRHNINEAEEMILEQESANVGY